VIEQIRSQIEEHARLAAALGGQAELLLRIAEALSQALRAGRRVYVLGNGGSAADAQHIAAEFVGRFRRERAPLPVVALTTDSSILTALGNDYGFEQVFSRQVEAMVGPGDVVWALSTSGESRNVLHAVRRARRRQALVIGFTGRDGGSLRGECDLCLCVDHHASARIQEVHQLAYHLICDLVEQALADEPAT